MLIRIAFVTASVAVFALSLIAGCGNEREAGRSDVDQQGAVNRPDIDGKGNSLSSGVMSPATTRHIAFLGDPTRLVLLRSIASANGMEVLTTGESIAATVLLKDRALELHSTRNESTVAQAGIAWEADLVLIAVDAREGVQAIHREHALLARQMGVPNVAVAFTNSQLVKDARQLAIERREVREMLNKYELPGNATVWMFDHAEARIPTSENSARGPQQITSSLGTVARKRRAEGTTTRGRRISSMVYFLVPAEVDPPGIAKKVRSGPATVLMRGEQLAAVIETQADISPGDVANVQITFDEPTNFAEVQRFALLNQGHITALGVVKSIVDP